MRKPKQFTGKEIKTYENTLSLTHIIREMQTKPTLTNYFSPARLAKIQSVTTYSRQGHEEQALLNFASGYAK